MQEASCLTSCHYNEAGEVVLRRYPFPTKKNGDACSLAQLAKIWTTKLPPLCACGLPANYTMSKFEGVLAHYHNLSPLTFSR